jgi:hypothetical protein
MHHTRSIHSTVLGLALLALSCGSNTAPVQAPRAAQPAKPAAQEQQIAVSSEVGALDEDAVNSVFERAQRSLMGCAKKGASRVELLGGDIAFYVGIDQSGRAADARVERSTIGDRGTETCMLAVLRGHAWPKPVGGRKGQVHKSFAFDMPSDARPPVEWTADDVKSSVKKIRKQLQECGSDGSGTYQITAYIDTQGTPISVGAASPEPVADSQIDCLVAVVKGSKFKSPGSYPAKVSFEL